MTGPATEGWRAIEAPADVADALVELYVRRGGGTYDEILSQTEHALQCGHLAMVAGAPDELVVAALLHDIGHLLMTEPPVSGPSRDLRHEDVGGRFLANWFSDAVTAPIRLHVAAKRYLCAVDPAYAGGLSAGSTRSLALQGGPMSAAEAGAFEAETASAAAVELRRWDEMAKVPDAPTPALGDFRELLVATLDASA